MNSTMRDYEGHVVCMPTPAQGHMNPMLNLARLLHSKGFFITFVLAASNHRSILDSGNTSLSGHPDFRFESLPDGLLDYSDAKKSVSRMAEAHKNCLAAPFRELLVRIKDGSDGVPPVACIISDVNASFTMEPAAEHGIPRVLFNTTNATSVYIGLHLKQLVERGLIPLKKESDRTKEKMNSPIDWIPGLNIMRLKDMPSFIRTPSTDDEIMLNLICEMSDDARKASAIVFHTIDALEHRILDLLSLLLPPVYAIGPLPLLADQLIHNHSPVASIELSMWKEDEGCIDWLNTKQTNSVIYVNFGSLATISNEQLIEFAWGLANSKHDFLWIIRPDLVKGQSAVLPVEFQGSIKGRGFLASWCPQKQVLSHPAVGGFLTHCGWNSTLESIYHGVPMLCWPSFADQTINARFVCEEWGIGMEIDSDVKREEVEVLVKELMEGEKGKQMRKNVLEWKESAVRATEVGGSSLVDFDRLVTEVLLKKKVKCCFANGF